MFATPAAHLMIKFGPHCPTPNYTARSLLELNSPRRGLRLPVRTQEGKGTSYLDHPHLNTTPKVKLSCNCYFGPLHVFGLPKWKQGVFPY